MAQKKYVIRPVNRTFTVWMLAALIVFAGITCFFSCTAQKKSLAVQCSTVLEDIFDRYYDKVYNFSDIYIPIFRSDDAENVMRSYFEREGEEVPSARERAKLVALLEEMVGQDGDIAFIALFNPKAEQNFCMAAGGNSLRRLWEDLPVGQAGNGNRMQLLGRYNWKDEAGGDRSAFLIRGGAMSGDSDGCIVVGYHSAIFEQILSRVKGSAPGVFLLANEEGVLFDSEGIRYGEPCPTDWLGQETAYHRDPEGKVWFTGVMRNPGLSFTAAYLLTWKQVILAAGNAIWMILAALACFAVFALTLYWHSSKKIFHKVEGIQEGLEVIGGNRLDYRLPVTKFGDEFDEIADNINRMTERLKDSIERECEMRVQQNRAELRQIQARFNPHFLYNTLEIIRGKLFQNGDLENADAIEKLSRIFRSLTDAALVISIREEIAVCSQYVALLQMRFQDAVEITYDISADVQECGILAHLIQPVIENYFVHAMSETEEDHTMEIFCELVPEDLIRFTIADNGRGISPDRLEELNRQLKNPKANQNRYGLVSVAERIQLFYGEDYGIVLEQNGICGVRVLIEIPRMSVEEHCRKLGIL